MKISYAKLILSIAVGVVAAGIIGESAGQIILPFLLSYLFARLLRPLGVFLAKKSGMREKTVCVVVALLSCTAAVYSIAALSSGAISSLGKLDSASAEAVETLDEIIRKLEDAYSKLPFHLSADRDGKTMHYLTKMLSSALSSVGSAAASVTASVVGGAAKALPSYMLSIFVGGVMFVYLMADMPRVGRSLLSLVPEKHRESVKNAFLRAADTLVGFVRAYFCLGGVVAAILFVGFLILRVPSPLLCAILIALADALPFIGCGIVLVPWGIIRILSGCPASGVGFFILSLAVWGVRQVLEPRFLSRSSGVNPYIMLAALFIGLRAGGFAGMLTATLTAVLLCGDGSSEEKS